MSYLRTLLSTSALSLLASGAVALTPEQVWTDLVDLVEAGGATVTVDSEETSGGTLTLNGIRVTTELPEDQGTSVTELDTLMLSETGDGSVAVIMPDRLTATTTSTVENETVEVTMEVLPENMEVVVSGEDRVERYDFTGERLTIAIADMQTPQEDGTMMALDLRVVSEGIDGVYDMTDGTPRVIENEATINRVGFSASGEIPEGGTEDPGSFSVEGEVREVTSSGATSLPDLVPGAALGAMIADGFSFAGTLAYGAGNYDVTGTSPDGDFSLSVASGGGSIDVEVGEQGLRYNGGSRDISFTVGGAMIPMPPLDITMAENGFGISMPLVPSEDPQDFAFSLALRELVLPETLWSMFDPQGALTHDPASLVIDVQGQATVREDITDPNVAESGTMPGELNGVTVNELRLALAGAELTGEGDFAFTTDENGIPSPTGAARLMLTGGNALLDGLTAIGLVPQEQAMGARMMIGLFAQPGDGPDTLVSEIEVQEGGAILANGQRIR